MLLYEFKCRECDSIMLLELDKNPESCPYCSEYSIDYAPGRIEPVLEYEPRKGKQA